MRMVLEVNEALAGTSKPQRVASIGELTWHGDRGYRMVRFEPQAMWVLMPVYWLAQERGKHER